MQINSYEYKILTKAWDGPYGAAYNAAYEFCYESGFIDQNGVVSPAGEKAIKDFENSS